MAKVQVKIQVKTSEGALFRLLLDGKRVRVNNAEAILSLARKNEDYVLSWFIEDVPLAKYSLKITEPEKLKMNYEATIDESRKDSALSWFKISE